MRLVNETLSHILHATILEEKRKALYLNVT